MLATEKVVMRDEVFLNCADPLSRLDIAMRSRSAALPSPPIVMLSLRKPLDHCCATYAKNPSYGTVALTKMMQPMDLGKQLLSFVLFHRVAVLSQWIDGPSIYHSVKRFPVIS